MFLVVKLKFVFINIIIWQNCLYCTWPKFITHGQRTIQSKKIIAEARGLELVKLVIGYGGNHLYYPRWAERVWLDNVDRSLFLTNKYLLYTIYYSMTRLT